MGQKAFPAPPPCASKLRKIMSQNSQLYNLLAKIELFYIVRCKTALESTENIDLGSRRPAMRLTPVIGSPFSSQQAHWGVEE
jgi:hypothetical protein